MGLSRVSTRRRAGRHLKVSNTHNPGEALEVGEGVPAGRPDHGVPACVDEQGAKTPLWLRVVWLAQGGQRAHAGLRVACPPRACCSRQSLAGQRPTPAKKEQGSDFSLLVSQLPIAAAPALTTVMPTTAPTMEWVEETGSCKEGRRRRGDQGW